MSNIDPSIANVMRGHMDVGSDNINHVHHLGRHSDTEPSDSVDSTEVVETVAEAPGSRFELVRELFGTAVKNLKGGGHGST